MRSLSGDGVDHVAVFNNDAFEVWLGYPDKWLAHYSRKDFEKIIRWYLWRRIYGEWFGLRRSLWYWLLKRRVARSKPRPIVKGE